MEETARCKIQSVKLPLWMYVLFISVTFCVSDNSVIRMPFGFKMCVKWCESLGNCNSVTFVTKTMACNLGNVITTPMSAGQRLQVTSYNTTDEYYRRIFSKLRGYVILKKRLVKKKDYKLYGYGKEGMCVKYHFEEKTWQDALTVCQSEGGSLFKVHHATRSYYLTQIHPVERSRQGKWPWIGVKFQTEDKAWHWAEGTHINASDHYEFWGSNEPKHNACGLGGHYSPEIGRWHTDLCTAHHCFICEVNTKFCYV